MADKKRFVPITPGGTLCINLESSTAEKAWKKLLRATAHMPYRSKKDLVRRGYTVSCIAPVESLEADDENPHPT